MKNVRRVLSLALSLLLVFALVSCATTNVKTGELSGKTVILHTNDVHGALEGYAYIPTLRAQYEALGADVIVLDAGDFVQGDVNVSLSKGASAVQMMNSVGYDVVTLGNHELDYGFDTLLNVLSEADFQVVCSTLLKKNSSVFEPYTVLRVGKLRIGIVGIQTPETKTKVNPNNIKGLTLADTQGGAKSLVKVVQKAINKAARESDIVICLAHLGVDQESVVKGCDSSTVFSQLKGWDFVIDAHSHTVMSKGLNGERNFQSTGTKFENIGVIVIDNERRVVVDHYNVATADLVADPVVLAEAKAIEAKVDAEYGAAFAQSEVKILGADKTVVRCGEAGSGDLIADAMLWEVKGQLDVADEYAIAITNGGGIRADINAGDVSKKDILAVLPFGNTLTVVYVTGEELLETLEASTYCSPTSVGAFPQVAGIEFTVDTTKEFDAGDLYPESTYNGPKSIQRVTINSINGKDFDINATYAVVTNNFIAAGGDTYYAFKAAYDAGRRLDLPAALDEVVVDYIENGLNGVIPASYEKAAGRIIFK